jgi:NAD(P)-dependent dehydrogenase (short-subunit alcohol dehydrogenase family)
VAEWKSFNRLAGRRIFVTGAASGIGRSIAEVFRAEGAALAVVDRDKDGIEAVARELGAFPITLDLADAGGIDAAVDAAAAELGGLDGVVNCAGIGVPTSIEDTDATVLARFIAINLTAPYLICRAALPHLRKEKGSTVVNIASGQGLLPNAPKNTAYAATKGGLITFTKSLAIEAAPQVRANVVCPGLVRTPMTQFLLDGVEDPTTLPFLQSYALKRMGEPEEVASAVLFLTSAESSLITGSALAVDAGRCYH